MGQVGTFTYRRRSGYQNLDDVRRKLAEQWVQEGYMEHLEEIKTYRFLPQWRAGRIKTLLYGLGRLEGGAKLAVHYEDVLPAISVAGVLIGGAHPFNYLFGETKGNFYFDLDIFQRAIDDAADRILSPIFIGWKPGFAPEEEEKLKSFSQSGVKIVVDTPRQAYKKLGDWIATNADCLDR